MSLKFRLILAVSVFSLVLGGLWLFKKDSKTPRQSANLLAQLPSATLALPSTEATTSLARARSRATVSQLSPTATARSSLVTATPDSTIISVMSDLPLVFKVRQTVSLKIQTLPAAQCSIKVILPSGSESGAKGLEAKTSDDQGLIAWFGVPTD